MEESEKKRLFIMDGNAYIYSGFYAIEELSTSTGIPTNAVFVFTNLLLKLLREEEPDYMAVAFDSAGPTFRHKEFAEYKADRPKMPDLLAQQFPIIREVIEAFNIPILEQEGYEADDIIGTMAKKAAAEDMEVVIVTPDKDAFQLVSRDIRIYPCRFRGVYEDGFMFDEQAVKERYGVEPGKITDFMGLVGDKIDNIPGVPGIGKKSAPKLLERFNSLEELLDHVDDIGKGSKPTRTTEKQKRLLKEYRDQALLSKRLATIDVNVPIDISLENCETVEFDSDKLMDLFRRLEFRKFIRDLDLGSRGDVEVKYHTILSESDLAHLVDKLKKQESFAVDTETDGLDPMTSNLVGISIAFQPHEAYYIPISHRYIGAPEQLPLELVLDRLRPILSDNSFGKIGQNIKYDMQVLRRHGVELVGISFDTMLASYVLKPSARGHSLSDLAMEYFGHEMIPIKDLIGKGKNQVTMSEVDVNRASEYACEDADITLQLKSQLESQLQKCQLESVLRDIELPLVPVLAEMEMTGINVDTAYLKNLSDKLAERLDSLTRKIYDLAGEEFNINSTKQLGKILFEKLKLPPGKRTKTGFSTNEAELERLSAAGHKLPSLILEFRSIAKLRSTYVDALPQQINPGTGRVHTSFNQAVTETGRLSSSNPNLQNIPVRTEEGREIRRAFIPGGECTLLLAADYSQIELRMLAHLSQDTTLMEAFQKGEDIHSRTASLIFGLPLDQISSDMRRQAKTINFGIIYGMGAFRLARELGISLSDAQQFIDSYFQTYSGVKSYFGKVVHSARENGYVTTISGRRRRIREINSRNRNTREFAERTAINTPVQGSAADLIKLAMIKIGEFLKSRSLKSRLLLQVHDELIFEVSEDELDEIRDNVCSLMENAIPLDVPVKVDVGVGKNWLEAK